VAPTDTPTTIEPTQEPETTLAANQTISITLYDLANNTQVGIPGTEQFEIVNATLDSIQLASVFNSSQKSRRSLSTKGGYDFKDKSAFIKFSIDASTTSGNVVELWMYSVSKFVETGLTISPDAPYKRSLTIGYSYSNASGVQSLSNDCLFEKDKLYTLKLGMVLETKWGIVSELYSGSTLMCTLTMNPVPFNPSTFFSGTFTYVVSQSSSGSTLKRSLHAVSTQESMSIKVQQLGVECRTGACAAAPATTKSTKGSLSSTLNIGMIAGVIAAFAVIALVLLLVGTVIAAVIIKRRKKRTAIIYQDENSAAYEDVEEDKVVTMYDAFGNAEG
jgi:hypothetical protein